MCEQHRNIPARVIEKPRMPLSPLVSAIASTRENAGRALEDVEPVIPDEILEVPAVKPVVAQAPVEQSKLPIKKERPTGLVMADWNPAWNSKKAGPVIPKKPAVQAKAPQPASAPVVAKPVEPPKRTGTLPNPNKVRKSDRVATSNNSNTSTLNADGTVNVDALSAYINSVPARGLGKRRRRR